MSQHKGYVASITCAVLFGLGTVLTKTVIADVHPLVATVVVYLTAGLGLFTVGAVVNWRRNSSQTKQSTVRGIDFKVLALGAFLGVVVAPTLFFWGMNHTTAVNASLLMNIEVLFTIALAYVFLKERVALKDYLAITLLLVSVIIVSTNSQPLSIAQGWYPLGNILVVVACIFWSIDNNLSKMLSVRHDLLQTVCFKSLIGGSIVLLMVALLRIDVSMTGETLMYLITVGILAYGIGVYCFFYGLKHIGAMKSISIFSTQAIFGMLFALFILGERWSVYHLVAVAIMFAGVWLLHRPKGRKMGHG